THTLSRSNPFSAIDVLRERSKLLRKTVYLFDDQFKEHMPKKNDTNVLEKELAYCKELEQRIEKEESLSSIPAVKEKLNLLKETIEDTQGNFILSKDTDAKTGHKSADSSFFGYKTHLAMTEERIITAAVVTSGEKGDGPQLPKLLEISQKNGIDVNTIIGDGAYTGTENIKQASDQNIKVVAKLNITIAQGARKEED
ncbi:transposase, partial [Flavobacterium sp. AC]